MCVHDGKELLDYFNGFSLRSLVLCIASFGFYEAARLFTVFPELRGFIGSLGVSRSLAWHSRTIDQL